MKRILHIHQRFYPHRGGSTTRLFGLIDSDDINTHIVLAQYEGAGPRRLEYRSIKIFTYKYYWQIPFFIYFISKKEGIDTYHSHNYRPLFFTWVYNITRFKELTWVHELHSMYLPSNKSARLIGFSLLKKPQRLVVLNKAMKDKLFESLGITSEVIYSIPNIPGNNIIGKSKNGDKLVLGYLGSLDSFQGITNIISLANIHRKNPKFQFIIVGGERDEMSTYIDLENMPSNLKYSEAVDISMVGEYYNSFDYLLMLRDSTLTTDYVIPLKPLEASYYGLKTIMYNLPVSDEIKTICGDQIILVRSKEWLEKKLEDLPKYEKKPQTDVIDRIRKFSSIEYKDLYVNNR